MCKLHGEGGAEAGGVDVSKGRELLPTNVVPKHYDVTLEPDFKKLTYEGKITVDLDVVEDTTSISLNTLELDIHSTSVIVGSQTIRLVNDRDGTLRGSISDKLSLLQLESCYFLR